MSNTKRYYLIDRNDSRNSAFLAGEAQSFVVWIERSSIRSCVRTADAFAFDRSLDLFLVEAE